MKLSELLDQEMLVRVRRELDRLERGNNVIADPPQHHADITAILDLLDQPEPGDAAVDVVPMPSAFNDLSVSALELAVEYHGKRDMEGPDAAEVVKTATAFELFLRGAKYDG